MKQKTKQRRAQNAEQLESFVNQEQGNVYKTVTTDFQRSQIPCCFENKRDTTPIECIKTDEIK